MCLLLAAPRAVAALVWALVFASILAYTLQEGTARLTIVSGKSLGQCLRVKYKNGAKIYDTAIICWLVGIGVFCGNTLYECNCWAGGIDAILAIPGCHSHIDTRHIKTILRLNPKHAMAALHEFREAMEDLHSSIRNKGGYMMGVLRKYLPGEAASGEALSPLPPGHIPGSLYIDKDSELAKDSEIFLEIAKENA